MVSYRFCDILSHYIACMTVLYPGTCVVGALGLQGIVLAEWLSRRPTVLPFLPFPSANKCRPSVASSQKFALSLLSVPSARKVQTFRSYTTSLVQLPQATRLSSEHLDAGRARCTSAAHRLRAARAEPRRVTTMMPSHPPYTRLQHSNIDAAVHNIAALQHGSRLACDARPACPCS